MSSITSLKRIPAMLISILLPFWAAAGVSIQTMPLKGTAIAASQVLPVEDNKLAYMIANPGWNSEFDNVSVKNRVRLKYEESARTFYSSAWSAEVRCSVERFD